MNNEDHINGLREALEACEGVRESGCEVAAGAIECINYIKDIIAVAEAQSLAAPAVANAANSDALPPLPEPTIEGTVMHPELKICYLAPVHFTADQMQAYAHAAIAHAAPNAQLVDDAARWQFMMRIADNEDGPEAQALESLRISNELMDDSRPASAQLIEMADQARAALASLPPQKEAL